MYIDPHTDVAEDFRGADEPSPSDPSMGSHARGAKVREYILYIVLALFYVSRGCTHDQCEGIYSNIEPTLCLFGIGQVKCCML